ncbi:thioredoxin domain-containing protein [Avrilella dinanensis]|uniref:Thioredoxin family protein n=1 Tax=Avrilella dinanensis TaxID=2008672 RepID=A0A2M9R7R5_9FLAO|nr:thioredoxin family protein [Avrilella dinanensis]PJR04881.1 thioredoxin family protein [Avrilella dinanensis]
MTKAVFYHAGCPVCVSAEKDILDLIPENQVEVIHLGTDKTKVKDAESAGVKSVPALVLSNGNVLHINFGASIEDLK